jgi:phage shock protein C
MYCTQCGTPLNDSARFCTSCGKPVGTSDPNAGAGQSAYAAPAPRRLRRILSQKKIAGVCAGFAEYFDTDLTLMRIIWVAVAILPPNIGVIAYIIAWAVMPKA